MFKFYSFKWLQFEEGIVKKSGQATYFSANELDIPAVKKWTATYCARDVNATIQLQDIQEISLDMYMAINRNLKPGIIEEATQFFWNL